MRCEQVKELLSAYLDNMLAEEEQQHVATHLQACAECRAILDDFRHFDRLLSNLPRISPDASLRNRIFSSPEYLKLTGTVGMSSRGGDRSVVYTSSRRGERQRPRLVSLPGGRHTSSSPSSLDLHSFRSNPSHRLQPVQGQRILQILIAATILLTLSVGSFIGWHLLQKQSTTLNGPRGITPPAGLPSEPLPAGVRFVFLRDGALWSTPTDGSGTTRLTPEHTTVATNWAVRQPLPGRPAGNMLAYIDLQQGFVHTIRSDGQSDTIIQQALLKHGVAPSSRWDTETGTAILNSLSWSKDGSMLAFVADPQDSKQPGLYIYSTNTGEVHNVPLPLQGAVSHPVWSPDGVRIAFELVHNGKVGILDYNTQNNGVLTLVSAVNTAENPHDTLLDLDWSPDIATPTITWSVGVIGHVHSIRSQSIGNAIGEQRLTNGDYVEATYSRTGSNGRGSWLLVTSLAGLPGDVISIDLSGFVKKLTSGKQVNFAQWSPDGAWIDYLDAPSSSIGSFHVINTTTWSDILVATNATTSPTPAWSPDSQHLAYSTGTLVLIVNVQTSKISHPLKLQGPATALSWSANAPNQLVLAMDDGQQGIYLVDTQQDTLLQLDKKSTGGSVQWTQIP